MTDLGQGPTESARLWRSFHQPGIELFKANFRRFTFDRHSHPQLAIGVIESGAEGIHYRGGKVVAPAGSLLLIDSDEMHTGFAADSDGYRYRMFYFDLDLIDDVARALGVRGSVHFGDASVADSLCFGLLQRLHHRMEVVRPDDALAEQSDVIHALSVLLHRYANGRSIEEASDAPGLNLAREYLSDNVGNNVSLDELAQVAGLSRTALIQNFCRRYGLTPHAWHMRARAERAKRLLLDGRRPAEVAFQLGYSDQPHLTRLIKRYYGVTPASLSAS